MALRRNHYPMATLDDILPDLQKAKIFSTVDTKNGYWQIELDEQSSDAVMPQQPSQQPPPQPAAAAAPRNAMPHAAAIFPPRSCLKPPDIVTRSGRQIKPPVRFNDYVAK